MREVRARCGRREGDHQASNDALGQSEALEQVILRELTGHTGHRRIAADLLSMEALDWDEGELLDEHSAICALVIGPRFWWINLRGVRSTLPGSLRTTSAELPSGEPSAINRQELTRNDTRCQGRGTIAAALLVLGRPCLFSHSRDRNPGG
jgi:hypothetical protein